MTRRAKRRGGVNLFGDGDVGVEFEFKRGHSWIIQSTLIVSRVFKKAYPNDIALRHM